MRFEDLPSRVQKIVREEYAAGQHWFPDQINSMDQLMNSMDRKSAKVRGAIWWRLYHYENEVDAKPMSYAKIAGLFARDHTSVRDAVLKHPENMYEWAIAKNAHYAAGRPTYEPA